MAEADYSKMSDDDLDKEIDRLAGERTKIREEQVAAAAEKEARTAIAGLSPEARKVLKVSLGGKVGGKGEATH